MSIIYPTQNLQLETNSNNTYAVGTGKPLTLKILSDGIDTSFNYITTNYTTNSNLNSTLSNYTTTSALTTLLSTKQNNLIFTSPLINTSNNVTIDLSGYTLRTLYDASYNYMNTTFSNSLNYIISNYTTTANLNSTLSNYTTTANLTSTLSNYTTTANLTSTLSGYTIRTLHDASFNYITTNYTTNSNLSNNYYNKTYIDTSLNNVYNKTYIDASYNSINSNLVNTYYNKTYIDTSFNNITIQQNKITVSNPFNLDTSNNLTLKYNTSTLQIDTSGNLNVIGGGGGGSSQWLNDGNNNIYVSGKNVGIGVTVVNPNISLDIKGNNSYNPTVSIFQTAAWNTTNFALSVYGYTNLYNIIISGSDNTNTINKLTSGNFGISSTTGDILFNTNQIEKMRIDISGNVGIGTTTPNGYKLNVNGDINACANLYCNTIDNSKFVFDALGSARFGFIKKSGSISKIVCANANQIILSALTSGDLTQAVSSMNIKDIMILNPSGDIQIPAGVLNLYGYLNITNSYSTYQGNNTSATFYNMSNIGPVISGYNAAIYTNGIECIRFSSGQNVGIGVTNPQNKLDMIGKLSFLSNTSYTAPSMGISGGSGDRIILSAGLSNAYPYSLGINGGTQWYSVPSGAVHKFYVNGSETLTINSNGVGIGTTSPSCLLDVSGNTASNIVNITQNGTWIGGSGNYALNVTGYSNFNGFRINGNDITNSLYKIAAGNIGFTTLSGDFVFNTNQIEKMRIKSDGSVTMSNTLSVSNSIDCGTISINGMSSNYNLNGNIDAANITNTYIAFKPNASNSDCCYLREIGGDNAIRLALDFHDDGNDAKFVIRNVQSVSNPDVIIEVFSVTNGGHNVHIF
mmetsp:Transcript_71740/g.191401  ORF Transcript_71740/g.191401 Transcript_71740/m.191401 type:complete len:856 (-) Transcript_71740:250-2817(-)